MVALTLHTENQRDAGAYNKGVRACIALRPPRPTLAMSTSLNQSEFDKNLGDTIPQAAESPADAHSLMRLERSFHPLSKRDWCELVRDIAAIANTGGGEVLLRLPAVPGVMSRGDVLRLLGEFSDSTFDDIELRPADVPGAASLVLSIGRALFPIVFTKRGSYTDPNDPDSQVEVFAAGSIYFWHAGKSEPGGTGDLREFFERLVRRVRRRWLRGIRRVLKMPIDAVVPTAARTSPQPVKDRATILQPVRITTDPDAPALQPQDVERLYPWRQKDLLGELNARLAQRVLTTYDIQAVRRHHRLDERPDFVFHLAGAGRRYSPAAADWFIEQHERDPEFFAKARSADQEMLKLRRQKPK
jgi:hypothetical protein